MNKLNYDKLGIIASILCAIHCAVLPVIGVSLPLLGVDLVKNKPFEFFMIAAALAIGLIAIIHGYKKHHKNMLPVILFSVGGLLLIVKEIYSDNLWLIIAAVCFIVAAHFINYRLCSKIHNHSGTCKHH
jgi:hypothetical protein